MPSTGSLPAEKLAFIASFSLAVGQHKTIRDGACALELVSFVAGEKWSDSPACVCPVLGAFFRSWNDRLPDDARNRILKPFLPRLIGTNGGAALAERRALMAADWLVRICTPAWLRLAKLNTQADALASLPEITAMAQIPALREPIEAARRDANAARAAVGTAALAARAAAGAAAGAAGAAAWAAARVAAWAALKPTRDHLVASAAELVERMLAAEVA